MMKCPRCGVEVSENRRFCGDCGSRMGPTSDSDIKERIVFGKNLSAIILTVCVFLFICAYGVYDTSEDIAGWMASYSSSGDGETVDALWHVSNELEDLSINLAILGTVGMFAAGFVLFLAYHIPKKNKK